MKPTLYVGAGFKPALPGAWQPRPLPHSINPHMIDLVLTGENPPAWEA